VDRAALEREVASAGWVIESGYSENLIIGNAGDLCILLPERSWQGADTEYELYDVEKNVACWVRAIHNTLLCGEVATGARPDTRC